MGGAFDVGTWEHREAFVNLVRAGTGTRPWSDATSGKRSVRLDAAVSDKFGLDLGQAKKVIVLADWRSEARDHSEVCTVGGEELPPHTSHFEF